MTVSQLITKVEKERRETHKRLIEECDLEAYSSDIKYELYQEFEQFECLHTTPVPGGIIDQAMIGLMKFAHEENIIILQEEKIFEYGPDEFKYLSKGEKIKILEWMNHFGLIERSGLYGEGDVIFSKHEVYIN